MARRHRVLIGDDGQRLPRLDSPKIKEIVKLLGLVLNETERMSISHASELIAQKCFEEKSVYVTQNEAKILVEDLVGRIRPRLSDIVQVIPWVDYSQEHEVTLKNGDVRGKSPTIRKISLEKEEEPGNISPYEEEEPDPGLLPTWFRHDKSTMIMLERQLKKARDGKKVILNEDVKQALDDVICGQWDEPSENAPPLTIEICSRKKSGMNLCDYVGDFELGGGGDEDEVLTFILYKFRSAMVSRVVAFMLDPNYRPVRDYVWFDTLRLFEHRFRKEFKFVGGSSIEKQSYWVKDLLVMLNKEGARQQDIMLYVNLAFDSMMWFALKQSNPIYWIKQSEAEKKYWDGDARRILNKYSHLKTKGINYAFDRAEWKKRDNRP